MDKVNYANWNPWHGCTKYSEGCRYCYVYRQDEYYGCLTSSSVCRKTQAFRLPVKKRRDGNYKVESGSVIFTCFSSDFFLKDADAWRTECWQMIKERSDCFFYFFTKRIDRFFECIPSDWENGYDNVIIGCTCENQDRADYRLPIFSTLPIKHKAIILAPMLTPIDISQYLTDDIEEVSCSGESGLNVRPLDYEWVLSVREQCVEKNVPFAFHQTGAYFIRDGVTYRIPRKLQISQARKANIDFRIRELEMPETASLVFQPQQISMWDREEIQ